MMKLIALLLLGKVLIGGLDFGATAATDAAKPLLEKGSTFLQTEATRHGVTGFKDLANVEAWLNKPEAQIKKAIDAIVRTNGNLEDKRHTGPLILVATAANSYSDNGSTSLKNYYTDLN